MTGESPTDRWPRLNPSLLSAASAGCVHFTTSREVEQLREPDNVALRSFDAGAISRGDELLSAVARALNFPDYFGGNWDALDECLRDLDEWLPASSYALVVITADRVWRQAPLIAGGLVDCWAWCNGERWLQEQVPFHLIWCFEEPSFALIRPRVETPAPDEER